MVITGERKIKWAEIRSRFMEAADSPTVSWGSGHDTFPKMLQYATLVIDGVPRIVSESAWASLGQTSDVVLGIGRSGSTADAGKHALILLALLEFYPPDTEGNTVYADELESTKQKLVAKLADQSVESISKNTVETASGPQDIEGIGVTSTGEVVVRNGGEWFTAAGEEATPASSAVWERR